jgi:putative transposase
MKRYSPKVGQVFFDGQINRAIRRRLPTGKIQLEDDNGELINLTDAELRIRWLSQEWTINEESLGSMANATYFAAPRDLSTYTEPQQRIAQWRMKYIHKIDPENTPYNVAIWRDKIIAAALELNDPNPPSPSTVQSWWRRYYRSRSILSLIPHSKPSSGPHSRPRYQIFEDVLAQVYLTNQKQPKLAVAEAVFRQIDAVNQSLPAEQHIRRPSKSTIYRWLDGLQQDLVDAAREGAEAARFKYRAALGSVKVSRVLERIEIDHTPLDLIVIDSLTQLPLGRPWLTLAIDAHSRMVVGFYISFDPPSSYSVLQCVRRAILPKDLWMQRFPDIKGSWPAFGIPELIAVDNGTDLHSDAVEAACLEMGIQILFCGSKTPQHKGAIERFFRTMNMGLIHRLPGTVFSDIDERGDYPAEDKSVIDMQDLVHLLTKWIVDIYNVSVHRGIKARPLDVWLDSAASRIIELPLHPAQLEVIVGIPAKRTLFHYGIELDGLQYNSEPLQMLRRRTGQNLPVDVKYYDDTVAHIHVFDPATKEYIKVPAKLQEYSANLQRSVHRLIRAHARKKFGDHCLSPQLLEARAEIEALVRDALKAKKMGSRKSGAGYLGHDSEAIIAGQDPLLQARRPIKPSKPMPPESLPSGLEDDLPEFSAALEGDQ